MRSLTPEVPPGKPEGDGASRPSADSRGVLEPYSTCLGTAVTLLGRGLWPVLIYPSGAKIPTRNGPKVATGKEPMGAGWGEKRLGLETMRAKFKQHPDAGVGVCLGPGRGPGGSWLADIEGDGPEAEESRLILFGGETVETMGWGSTRGAHSLLAIDPERLGPLLDGLKGYEQKGANRVGVYKIPELPGLEFRIGGFKADGTTVKQVQSVVPPTPGTDGKPRKWNGVETIAAAPEAFYGALGRFQAKPAPKAEGKGKAKSSDRPEPTAYDRARAYLAKVDPAISGQRGHDRTFYAACKLVEFGVTQAEAERLLLDEYNPRCEPRWSEAEIRHKVEDAFRENADKKGAKLQEDRNGHDHYKGNGKADGAPEDLNRKLARRPRTDLGNAERLVARHGRDLRFCHPWNKYLVWDGRRWAIDQTAAARRRAKEAIRQIFAEAATIEDEEKRKEHVKFGLVSEARGRLDAMLALAAAEDGVPILPAEMDADPWLFNCLNGTIDLRTGKLRPHRREDLITKLCPLEFDPKAECPLWDSTLDLFFAKNRDLIAYWQRVCGYALVGVIRDHVMPVAYGKGSNGKSTILGALLDAFGPDYAMKCPPDMLMAKKMDGHPTDRADLFGKRLVVAIETESGRRLNETMVKELTGGDSIRARRMREDFWEFRPTHTLLMATNHKPRVRGTDNGIWRRLRLVPFTVAMDGKDAKTDMPERLRTELPGILAWCVRGCLDWQAKGRLDDPEEVTKATDEYRKEQDILGVFLGEHTVERLGSKVKAGDLYARYKQWAEAGNEFVMSLRAFGEALEERGIEKKPSNFVWYLGIELRGAEDQERERGSF